MYRVSAAVVRDLTIYREFRVRSRCDAMWNYVCICVRVFPSVDPQTNMVPMPRQVTRARSGLILVVAIAPRRFTVAAHFLQMAELLIPILEGVFVDLRDQKESVTRDAVAHGVSRARLIAARVRVLARATPFMIESHSEHHRRVKSVDPVTCHHRTV